MINGNPKETGVRVSFSTLRNQQHNNKQNQLSFQNLKKNNVALTSQNSSSSFRNKKSHMKENNIYFGNFAVPSPNIAQTFQTSSLKLASRIKKGMNGAGIGTGMGPEDGEVMKKQFQEKYEESQRRIKECLQQYNEIFNEIMEMLTDMQIKDLMKFNELLERNEKILENKCDNEDYEAVFETLSIKSSAQTHRISDMAKMINKMLRESRNSFDFRSTYQSKTIDDISPRSLAVSPKIHKKNQKDKEQSLQDTPESVKSKLSCVSSKLKPEKAPEIGMFDKINICESIQERVSFNVNSISSQNKKINKNKQHYRYGRNSQE